MRGSELSLSQVRYCLRRESNCGSFFQLMATLAVSPLSTDVCERLRLGRRSTMGEYACVLTIDAEAEADQLHSAHTDAPKTAEPDSLFRRSPNPVALSPPASRKDPHADFASNLLDRL